MKNHLPGRNSLIKTALFTVVVLFLVGMASLVLLAGVTQAQGGGQEGSLVLSVADQVDLLVPFDVVVTAYDEFDNVDTDYTGTVELTSPGESDSFPVSHQFTLTDQGVYTFTNLVFKVAGTQSITASDGTLISTTAITVDDALVIIEQDILWDETNVTLGTLIVSDTATLTLTGATTLTATNITIAEGAAILADGQGYGNELGPGAGEYSYDDGGGGAGHGGVGGQGAPDKGSGIFANGGGAYGSVYEPTTLGSGGGNRYSEDQCGGAGGGAVHLVVSDTLHVDGHLLANGIDGVAGDRGCGGGSGGSLWIETATLTGTGSIRANGGDGSGVSSQTGDWRAGGGAGGRIAIYAYTNTLTNTIEASGGLGYEDGGAGTIYFEDLGSEGTSTLLVDNGESNGQSAALLSGAYEFDRIELINHGHLTVMSGTSVLTLTDTVLAGDGTARLRGEGTIVAPSNFALTSITLIVQGELVGPQVITTTDDGGLELYADPAWHSGVYTFTNLQVDAGTMLRLVAYNDRDDNYEDDFAIEVRVENLTIAEGGLVSADGQGYGSEDGPGAGEYSYDRGGGGAGHGGNGGRGSPEEDESFASGGGAYGSVYEPATLGSGGGNRYSEDQCGGAGGGAVHLVVSDTLHVDGHLLANGIDGVAGDRGCGGGSGGSLWIETATLTGTGSIQANGGVGSGDSRQAGGGAGGRIALYAETRTFSEDNIQALGGSGYEDGQDGTIYLDDVDPLSSTITAWPNDDLIANGVATSTITVTLLTTEGYPVPGKEISLEIQGTDNFVNGVLLTGTQMLIGTSNISGVITATLASTRGEVKILDAWAGVVRLVNTTAVTFTAGPPDVGESQVWATPEEVAADDVTTATIHVQVYDEQHNPIPGQGVILTLSDTIPGITLTQPAGPTGSDGHTQGTIRSAVPGVVTVTAIIDAVPISDTAQVTFVGADLVVNKTGPAEELPGQSITYTLQVANQGLLAASNVVLTDTLPGGVTLLTQTSAYTFTADGNVLVWQLGKLDPDQDTQFLVQALISSTAEVGTELINQVEAKTGTVEGDSIDNTASLTTVVAQPLPALSVAPRMPVLELPEGATASLTVTLQNDGAAVLTNVHLLEPPHLPWVTLSQTGTWTLEPGQSLAFTVTAAPPLGHTPGQYRDSIWACGHGVEDEWIGLAVQLLGPTRTVRLAISNTMDAAVSLAQVQMQRREPAIQVTEGVTATYHPYFQGTADLYGQLLFEGLEVGTYDYLVEAEHHTDVTGTLTVISGTGQQDFSIVMPALPALALEPNTLEMGVTRGQSIFHEAYVRNAGAAPLHNVVITASENISWVHFGLLDSIDVIPPGEGAAILIFASPFTTTTVGHHQDYVYINSADGGPAMLALDVEVTDHQTRTVIFQVSESLTKPLANVEIILTRQEPALWVTEGVTQSVDSILAAQTDANGIASFKALPPGTYNYQVSAVAHEAADGTIDVEPGQEPMAILVDLAYYPFLYEWTVVPTTLTDTYRVTLRLTYETQDWPPLIRIGGEMLTRTCEWPGGLVSNVFHVANLAIIKQTVVSIGSLVNYELGPLQSGSVASLVEAQCGANVPGALINYPKATKGPTYTFNPSSFTSLNWLTPTQNFGLVYGLEVVYPFAGIYLEVEEPTLDWITLTNPLDGIELWLGPGEEFPLTLSGRVPEDLAEGVYTDTILLHLIDPTGVITYSVKKSYLHISATKTSEGLRLHTTFDPG